MLVKTTFDPPPISGSIWASAAKFEQQTIFYAAICTVHHKLQLKTEASARSLSGSYAHCCTEPEDWEGHLDKLMRLSGIFDTAALPMLDENNNEINSYGFASPAGISINQNLLKEAWWCGVQNAEDWMSKFDGVALFGLLQQTLEHELGHLMNHQHLLADPQFKEKTPNKPPLYGVLETSCFKFASPLAGKIFFTTVKDSIITHPNHDKVVKPQTVEELIAYMGSYPRFDFTESLNTTQYPRKRIAHPTSTPAKKVARREKASPLLPLSTILGESLVSVEKHKHFERTSKQTETGIDWKDRHDGHPSDDDIDVGDIIKTWTFCDISVQLCDKDRVQQDQFVVGETVYVKLIFTNRSKGTAYIHMDCKTFRRSGIQLVVDDLEALYVPSWYGNKNNVVVAIAQGETYSFFRVLCLGDTVLARKHYMSYAAPDKPGEYASMYMVYGGMERQLPGCTLKVVSDGEVPDLESVTSS